MKRDRNVNRPQNQSAAASTGQITTTNNSSGNIVAAGPQKGGYKAVGSLNTSTTTPTIATNQHKDASTPIVTMHETANSGDQQQYQLLRNDRNGNAVTIPPHPHAVMPAFNDMHQMGPYIQVAGPSYQQYIPCYSVDGSDSQSMFMAPIQYGVIPTPAAGIICRYVYFMI